MQPIPRADIRVALARVLTPVLVAMIIWLGISAPEVAGESVTASSRPAAVSVFDEPFDPIASGDLPQYIFFNKAPGPTQPPRWNQNHAEGFSVDTCREIVERIGTTGHDRLRVGVSFIFSIMETPPERLAASLRRFLESAQAADVPVLITLDGQNWWETRSDLWNWWDPESPGYSLANRRNVEWTSWSPSDAVMIGWRNWGSQIRVRPAPNISAPRFLAEHWKAYDKLIPVITRWYDDLPPDRKYLFGGVKVGWEASINVNAYHYQDGNQIFEESPTDASHDPTHHSAGQGWTFGTQPLGFAAVSTAGIRTRGELEREDIEEVVRRYLERLAREAHRRGIPRHMIFTHQGGTYAPWERHLSFKPAINAHSIPGWSFYSHDPSESGSLASDLEAAGRRQWVAAEWWRGAGDRAGWIDRFNKTLEFKQCRLICVYNWESFVKDAEALAAARELVDSREEQSRP